MQPEGPPIVGQLSSFPGVEFPIVPGRCYTIVARLAPDAQPGDVVGSFQMSTKRQKIGGLTGQPNREHPTLTGGPYCPIDPGTLGIVLKNRLTYAPMKDAGKGRIEVQLFSAPSTAAELAAREEEHAHTMQRIASQPADCDDCGFNCRQAEDRCERRCFVNHREMAERDRCEETCEQIGDACESGCSARC